MGSASMPPQNHTDCRVSTQHRAQALAYTVASPSSYSAAPSEPFPRCDETNPVMPQCGGFSNGDALRTHHSFASNYSAATNFTFGPKVGTARSVNSTCSSYSGMHVPVGCAPEDQHAVKKDMDTGEADQASPHDAMPSFGRAVEEVVHTVTDFSEDVWMQ